MSDLLHWMPPAGPSMSHTRAWIEFRSRVRASAAEECSFVETDENGDEWACGGCASCEARWLIETGRA